MSLPTFPAEIWHEILRLSVEIPGALNTEWDYSPDIALWHEWEPSYYYTPRIEMNREYYATLKTKLAIVQVSRTWREIGVKLLYEHLLFDDHDGDARDVEEVFRPMTMVASIFERHINEPGYGRATKRVDIPPAALYHSILPILLRLLNLCHNLRVFIVSTYGVYRGQGCNATNLSDLASLLQSRFHHSLRRISFNIMDIHICEDSRPLEYHIHLPNLPLESLELGSDSSSPYQPPAAITTVSALTIQAACVSLRHMVLWDCPALRHLTLLNVDDECVRSCHSFLLSHGPQLVSLALISLRTSMDNHSLSRLISPAPNLRCLVFDLLRAEGFSEKDIFPSITHIGLRLKLREAHLKFYSNRFFTASSFPNLKCLRFLDISDERPWWLLDIAQKFSHTRVENKHCQSIR